MFEYQKTNHYFAQIASGIEESGKNELRELGAENPQLAHRGIYFNADRATLYRINYQSRLLSRVLAPMLKFGCHSTRYLYNKASEIEWDQFFTPEHTFAVFANVSNSQIKHSQYAALKLKDAIADYFREKYGKRPNVKRINPDVWISLHIENDLATISWDTSGGALHRRGYRIDAVEAPMQETLAAAIIRLSGWDGSTPLYDPFCGSGTLLAEALMNFCRIPAGYLRKRFGFEFLPDFEAKIWEKVKKEADSDIRDLPEGLISGSDISSQAIKIAQQNLKRLPQGEKINIGVKDFRQIESLGNSTIVCNPPYGIRMKSTNEMSELYKTLGDFLKHHCKNARAFIYFGDRNLIPAIGLKPSWKKPLRNGGLDGRLARFEIY